MNRADHQMEQPQQRRRRKLVDYTHQGRPDMSCNRGTPYLPPSSRSSAPRLTSLNRPPGLNAITEAQDSHSSMVSSSSCSFASEPDDEEEVVDFFLKIPRQRRRRSMSRKELMTLCEQHSDGQLITRQRSSRSADGDGRRYSFIDNVLRLGELDQALRKRHHSLNT